jgi:hypothetical protein
MAALLGNMRPALQNPALGNYGGGLQPPTQGGMQQFGMQPMPRGGLGGPVQAAPGAPASFADTASLLSGAGGGLRKPMPSFGAPGGGAGGGKGQVRQAIGQLPGGPPMQQRLGGALGNRLRRPGMPLNPPNMAQGR